MAKYKLLVTDITEFGTLRCIAGYDIEREKMIRPEPAPGAFWESSTVGPRAQFGRSAIIEFEAHAPNPSTEYPHRTEDRVVAGPVNRVRTLNAADRKAILDKSISPSLKRLYADNLQIENLRGYVRPGTECRSLGAIEVDLAEVAIFEDEDWGKKRLRCRMRYEDRTIIPTITSSLVRETYRQGGIKAVLSGLATAKRLHLRIGLARAFPQKPDRCYIQINDLYVIR